MRIEIELDFKRQPENWKTELVEIIDTNVKKMHSDVQRMALRDLDGNAIGFITKRMSKKEET